MTNLKENILKEKKVVNEMLSLSEVLEKTKDIGEKRMISSQINALKISLRKINDEVLKDLENTSLVRPLQTKGYGGVKKIKQDVLGKKTKLRNDNLLDFEKVTLKRLKKEEEEEEEKVSKQITKKPSKYVKNANLIFSKYSTPLSKKKTFIPLKRNLIKSNLQFLSKSYISVIFFTTLLSIFASIFIFIFFLFFNIGAELPIITLAKGNIGARFLMFFWILFVIPIATFIVMYVYPSLEKKSLEIRINQELPFAAINMASISGSMIDPSKIFSIIITTKEYPYLEKEFTKLINEINVLGYDLVTALRNLAYNSPSKKLSDLFNGLATTITSGGNLPDFFEKRAQSLLFEYRLEREKYTKSSETFMDIYISVVIAAPMILMLLLMMMKISGLGISLSTSMISLVMVLGVSIVNVFFLTFLHLKQPTG